MEFELWYLVALPLVFAAGWFGRGFESRARATDNAALPRSYFRGLNLLLNDQHDKAIDAFIEVKRPGDRSPAPTRCCSLAKNIFTQPPSEWVSSAAVT